MIVQDLEPLFAKACASIEADAKLWDKLDNAVLCYNWSCRDYDDRAELIKEILKLVAGRFVNADSDQNDQV